MAGGEGGSALAGSDSPVLARPPTLPLSTAPAAAYQRHPPPPRFINLFFSAFPSTCSLNWSLNCNVLIRIDPPSSLRVRVHGCREGRGMSIATCDDGLHTLPIISFAPPSCFVDISFSSIFVPMGAGRSCNNRWGRIFSFFSLWDV